MKERRDNQPRDIVEKNTSVFDPAEQGEEITDDLLYDQEDTTPDEPLFSNEEATDPHGLEFFEEEKTDPGEPVTSESLSEDESDDPTQPGIAPPDRPTVQMSRRQLLRRGGGTLFGGAALAAIGSIAASNEKAPPADLGVLEKKDMNMRIGETREQLQYSVKEQLKKGEPIDFSHLEQRLEKSMLLFAKEWGFEKEEEITPEMKEHAKGIVEGVKVLLEGHRTLVGNRKRKMRDMALVRAWLEVTSDATYNLHDPYLDHVNAAEKEVRQPESVKKTLALLKPVLPKGFLRFSDGKRTIADQRRQFVAGANNEAVEEELENLGLPQPDDDDFPWDDVEVMRDVKHVIKDSGEFDVSIPVSSAPHVRGMAVDFAVNPRLRLALSRYYIDRSVIVHKVNLWAKRKAAEQYPEGSEDGKLKFHAEKYKRQKALHIERVE